MSSSRTRVLFFRPTLGQGGADRSTVTVLRHLDRSRFEPALALVRAEGEWLSAVPDDVEVIDLRARRLAMSSPRLASVLGDRRPDVLFSTCSSSNIAALLARAQARVPCRLVLSERNALLRGHLTAGRAVEYGLKHALYRFADHVTAVSQGVKDEITAKLRLPADRISVVYNPVITDDMAAQAAMSVDDAWFQPGEPPVVLAVGRLVPQKDYPTMLRAFAAVRRRVRARLYVLGEGPERDRLIAEANRLGAGDDVRFAGFDANPFRYMARCAVYAASSRAEGLPGALIQAMACGAPAVVTDCEHGPREVIGEPGRAGFLVPVGDAESLAADIAALLEDEPRRASVGRRGAEVAARFGVASSVARYEAAIVGATPSSTAAARADHV